MNDGRTDSSEMVFCHKCGANLSKAINIIYINGLPICPWCLKELNKKN